MSVYMHAIACEVPEFVYSQETIRQHMLEWLSPDRKTTRYINRVYRESGIDKRHSVLADTATALGISASKYGESVGTGHRNRLYTEAARKLYVDVARRVLEESDEDLTSQITHVVTVSCTGFFNPGPDYEIVTRLGLNPTVHRFHIGFMGCYGAFPAMRLAYSICQADPQACVLVAGVELCSLHLQVKTDLDSILGGALFADGAAAMIVNCRPPADDQAAFRLSEFGSTLLPDSEADMAWTIGDQGFEMVLSQYVPRIIETNLLDVMHPTLNRWGQSIAEIDHWAVHPGGKTILDKIEASLLLENRLDIPRRILREYGNMSSVTILFVLEQIRQLPTPRAYESVLATAFGPGLTMEVALMEKVLSKSQESSLSKARPCPVAARKED